MPSIFIIFTETISAENIDCDMPYDGEVPYAFLRLRNRGWLVIEGEKYGLTPEGCRAVQDILSRDEDTRSMKKFKAGSQIILCQATNEWNA